MFFTWVVRGVADTVSMWDAVERVTSFCKNIPEEASIASNLTTVESAMKHHAAAQAAMHHHYQNPDKDGAAVGKELVTVAVDGQHEGFGAMDEGTLGKVLQDWPATGDIRFDQVRRSGRRHASLSCSRLAAPVRGACALTEGPRWITPPGGGAGVPSLLPGRAAGAQVCELPHRGQGQDRRGACVRPAPTGPAARHARSHARVVTRAAGSDARRAKPVCAWLAATRGSHPRARARAQVGRTGSGKTTLLMALFRMFELAYGRIIIDGVNIAALPLGEVRSRLAIIPQVRCPFRPLAPTPRSKARRSAAPRPARPPHHHPMSHRATRIASALSAQGSRL